MLELRAASEIPLRLEIERVALLYRQNIPGVIGLVLYAFSYAYVCGDVMGAPLLTAWLAVVILSSALRILGSWYFSRSRDRISSLDETGRWLWFIQSQLFVSGALWGVAGWMMRYSNTAEQQLFITMTVVFMVAGAIVCWSISPRAMFLVVVPAFVPWSLGQLFSNNPDSILMGCLSLLYLILGSRVGMSLHRYVEDSLKLNIENGQLNEVLQNEIKVKAQAEESLRLALSSSHAMEWSWDPTKDLFICKGDLGRSLGLDLRYFSGTRDQFLQLLHDSNGEDRDRFRLHLDQVSRQGGNFEAEVRVRWEDEGVRDLVFRGRTPLLSNESAVPIVGIAWDTTARKIQARIQQERDLHEAANKAKSIFLANASHEIRTPLAAISGFVEALLQNVESGTQRPQEIKTDLQAISRNCRHLISLVNDCLDLSKFENGRLCVQNVSMNLQAEIQDSVAMVRSALDAKGIHFELRCNDLPDEIRCDALRFRQILVNLFSNAIKFTKKGSLTVTVSQVGREQGSGRLIINVKDTGIGMDESTQSHLFEPFVRGTSEAVQRVSGSGLGLTLSRNLARSLGGDLRLVASSPGVGSEFELSLVTADLKAVEVEAPASRSLNSNQALTNQLPGVSILVVDDDQDLRDLMRRFLERQNAQVSTAMNGQQALELAGSSSFDLILMDMKMPVLDGYQATAELRRRGYTLPIIALTAYANTDDKQRSLHAGCDNYLTKPVDFNMMVNMVRSYVRAAEPAVPSIETM